MHYKNIYQFYATLKQMRCNKTSVKILIIIRH